MVALAVIFTAKLIKLIEQDEESFTVTEGIEYGYFPAETQFERHRIALGLSYKAEFQDQMTEGFTERIAEIVDIEMFMHSKVAGEYK